MTTMMQPAEVNELALQAIAQNSASIQATAEQILLLAGATARATAAAKQAVALATEVKNDVTDLKLQVNELDHKLQQRVHLDQQQRGTLYHTVHERAGWAFERWPVDDYKTHIRRIWNKIKRDLVVSSYHFILAKDYDMAMKAAMAYPGFGRNWPVK